MTRKTITKHEVLDALLHEPLLYPGLWMQYEIDNGIVEDPAECRACLVGQVLRRALPRYTSPKISAIAVELTIVGEVWGFPKNWRERACVAIGDLRMVNALSIAFEGCCNEVAQTHPLVQEMQWNSRAAHRLLMRLTEAEIADFMNTVRKKLAPFIREQFPESFTINVVR